MAIHTEDELRSKRCVACEKGVEKMSPAEARVQLQTITGWEMTDDATRLFKRWEVMNFLAGIAFLNQVAQVAEQEGHHPDLHLENYRQVRIALSTHAVEGLTLNDFILAAKIDEIPVQPRG